MRYVSCDNFSEYEWIVNLSEATITTPLQVTDLFNLIIIVIQ